MRSKRDIKKGRLCTRGGEGGKRNRDTVSDQNMPSFTRLYALVVPLKDIPDFRLKWSNYIGFLTKRAKKA